jgi:2-keto-3-deoxy-galactonokinase
MSDLQAILDWIETKRTKEREDYKRVIRNTIDEPTRQEMRAELNGIVIGLDMVEARIKELTK